MKRNILYLMAALSVMGCHSGHSDHNHSHESETAELHDHDHDHEGHNHDDHNVNSEEEESHSSDEIIFDEHKQELFGIELQTVQTTVFSSVIHVGGRFLPAQGDDVSVIAPVSGIITLSSPSLSQGSSINKGKVIATLSSAVLAGGDPLIKSKAAYEAAKAEYLRDSVMVLQNIVAQSHYEQSRLAYIQAKSEYEALEANSSAGAVAVLAPKGGYLKSIVINSGQFVEAGQTVAIISQGSRLFMEAEVPERYASSVNNVIDANFTVPSGETYSIKTLGGKVLGHSHNSVDGYFTVTFEVPDNGLIVPGSFSEIWLKSSTNKNTVNIPLSAVIEEQGVYSVFVQLDEEGFQKREVVLGQNDGFRAEVLSGLGSGETIVTKGAMHIKLASVSSVPSGHNHQH